MVAEAELEEYLGEIRAQVCSRCVERPPGGPPCAPLGKRCGIEMHLPQLIDSIHAVHSDLIERYLEHNRQTICSQCAFLHSSICPCPMEHLLVLLAETVETVDERIKRREQAYRFVSEASGVKAANIETVREAHEQAAGTWTGCDWPTHFGKIGLDLNGWTAAEADKMALQATNTVEAQDWQAAARWLARVEERAQQAEEHAVAAVSAANAGAWREAFQHAYEAWALEFATGRPIWRGFPMTWQGLRQAVEAVLRTQGKREGEE